MTTEYQEKYSDETFSIQVYSTQPLPDPFQLGDVPYVAGAESPESADLECKRLQKMGVIFFRDDEHGAPAFKPPDVSDIDAYYSHLILATETLTVLRTVRDNRPCKVLWINAGVVRRNWK